MSKRKPVEKLYSIHSHRVQVLMAERKFKLRHLAERLGVTIGAVGHVINNRRPSSALRVKLAKALGVELESILDKSKVVKLKPKGRPSLSTSTVTGSSPALAASSQSHIGESARNL